MVWPNILMEMWKGMGHNPWYWFCYYLLFVCVSDFISDCQCSNLKFMMLLNPRMIHFVPFYTSVLMVCMLHSTCIQAVYVCYTFTIVLSQKRARMCVYENQAYRPSFTFIYCSLYYWKCGRYSVLACTLAKK